jgi:hypothetical protein
MKMGYFLRNLLLGIALDFEADLVARIEAGVAALWRGFCD